MYVAVAVFVYIFVSIIFSSSCNFLSLFLVLLSVLGSGFSVHLYGMRTLTLCYLNQDIFCDKHIGYTQCSLGLAAQCILVCACVSVSEIMCFGISLGINKIILNATVAIFVAVAATAATITATASTAMYDIWFGFTFDLMTLFAILYFIFFFPFSVDFVGRRKFYAMRTFLSALMMMVGKLAHTIENERIICVAKSKQRNAQTIFQPKEHIWYHFWYVRACSSASLYYNFVLFLKCTRRYTSSYCIIYVDVLNILLCFVWGQKKRKNQTERNNSSSSNNHIREWHFNLYLYLYLRMCFCVYCGNVNHIYLLPLLCAVTVQWLFTKSTHSFPNGMLFIQSLSSPPSMASIFLLLF